MTGGFDPTSLDWSKHGLGAVHEEIGTGMFLADFARLLGNAIHEAWSGGEATWIVPPAGAEPDIPEVDDAFVGPVRPIAAMHARYGEAVRRVLSPAAWQSIRLRLQDPRGWQLSHRRDPADGVLRPELEIRSRLGRDSREPITHDNWHAAWEMATFDRHYREYAIDAMARVALGIAKLALAEQIVVVGRPVMGGASTPVPLTVWHGGIDSRMRLLASCAVNLTDPDPTSEPATHLLFVEGDDLAAVARRYGDANFVCAYPEIGRLMPAGGWSSNPIEDDPRDVDADDDVEADDEQSLADDRSEEGRPSFADEVAEFVWAAAESRGAGNWRGNDLLALAEARFGHGLEALVRDIRGDLAAFERDGERPFRFLEARGRPPRHGTRPAGMRPPELDRLVSEIDAEVAKRNGEGPSNDRKTA